MGISLVLRVTWFTWGSDIKPTIQYSLLSHGIRQPTVATILCYLWAVKEDIEQGLSDSYLFLIFLPVVSSRSDRGPYLAHDLWEECPGTRRVIRN